MAKAHIHQIFNDETSRGAIDPEFIGLADLAPEHPDWLEYGTIAKFLRQTTLAPGELYGFLTSRFQPETEIPARDLMDFLGLVGDGYDVVNFTPFPDQHALFWNVFEQGEYQVPGHAMLAQDTIAALGLKADITELVMDSRTSIFRTYFAATPGFWEKGLALADKLVALTEAPPGGPAGALRDRLNLSLPRRQDMPGLMAGQQKVAIMERLASLVLALNPDIKAVSYQPFLRPRTRSAFAEFPLEAVLSDALKIAFNVRGDQVYKHAFGQVREQVQKAMQAKQGG